METFDDTPKNLSTFTYLQPYTSKNHCEQQLTKDECLALTTVFGEPVTQREVGGLGSGGGIVDDRRRLLMVTQDQDLPHGCLNYVASLKRRRLQDELSSTTIQVYYNNASTSTKSCPANVCICKSNPLPTALGDGTLYDHYALTKTGPLDVNLTLQECKSVAKRYGFNFQYYDDGKLSFPKILLLEERDV